MQIFVVNLSGSDFVLCIVRLNFLMLIVGALFCQYQIMLLALFMWRKSYQPLFHWEGESDGEDGS